VFLRDLCALLSVVSVLSFPEARVSRPLPSACEIVPKKEKAPTRVGAHFSTFTSLPG